MRTLDAFAQGLANRGKSMKVFDWNKAARIIKDRKPSVAYAGLEGDWDWTGGIIYENNKPVPKDDTHTYLASTWATPQLVVNGDEIACYLMESDVPVEWGTDFSGIYWPDSALATLRDTTHE